MGHHGSYLASKRLLYIIWTGRLFHVTIVRVFLSASLETFNGAPSIINFPSTSFIAARPLPSPSSNHFTLLEGYPKHTVTTTTAGRYKSHCLASYRMVVASPGWPQLFSIVHSHLVPTGFRPWSSRIATLGLVSTLLSLPDTSCIHHLSFGSVVAGLTRRY